jgi:hypothetical protein
MKALKAMGYAGVALGSSEAGLTYRDVIAEWALQFPEDVPVLAGNLIQAEENFPDSTHPFTVKQPKGSPIKVGVTAVTGPTVATQIKAMSGADKTMLFSVTPAALDAVLAKMAPARPDLRVLLYQGPPTRGGDKPTEAMACAQAYPQFPLVLCLSAEDEASSTPHYVTNPRTKARSLVVSVGRKGKHLGVVGVWRTGKADKPFEFRYQLVDMTEDFLTAQALEKEHPILQLMEEYTAKLKKEDFLNKYGQRKHVLQVMDAVKDLDKPGTPTYAGSAACKGCHKKAYQVWEKSDHSHAYQTLVSKARRPSNRQYDPECIVCHTVGFGYQGGFRDEKKTPKLKNVGCESCHGPASLHVANPNNEEWQARLNPWRKPEKETPEQKKQRINRMDLFCQNCHDIDNDVHWRTDPKTGKTAFEQKKWKLIAH